MALLVLRAIFFMVAMGIAVLIFGSEGIRQGPSWVPWAVLLGMAAVPLNPGVIDTDMLRSCWADGAAAYPKAEAWAKTAAPFILKLGPRDNGQSLTVG